MGFTTEPGDISAWNSADVARALRRARTAQGLRVDEVGQAAGVSAKDLRALESASLDSFPDSLSALRAVRRSADYLGLPGDQLALVLMERWPLRAHPGISPADPTSVVPAVGRGDTPTVEATATGAAADTGPPTEVAAGRWRGAERRVLFGAAAAAGGTGTSEVLIEDVRRHTGAGGRGAGNDDGFEETDAVLVGGPGGRGAGHSLPDDAPPAWLRMVVVAIVVAVLAGVAGILVHGHGGGTNASGTTASSTNHTTTKTTTTPTKSAKSTKKVAFTIAKTSPTSANITVGAPSFTVTITAVRYPAWVQATAPTKSAPVFSGMIYAGQVQSFPVHRSLTVETGSVAGHATVTVGSKQVGAYAPPAAPYYMTFKAG